MDASASKKRILILGCGFGGVATARHLERLLRHRPDVEIVLVSRDNFLLMTPLLFEVFSGALDLRACSFPIRAFLRTAQFVEATVQNIDLDRRVVRLAAAVTTSDRTKRPKIRNRSNPMSTDSDGLPERGSIAEYVKRFEQPLAEIDGALGQLGEEIRVAEQKSKYVIREVPAAFEDT